MSSVKESAARLEGLGRRVTAPRRAVLDAIARSPTLFTIEDVCAAAPEVGRATVFRTIKLLQEADVVCRVPLEDGSVRYQLSHSEHHHHLICSDCGSVQEFSDAELDGLIREDAREAGFRLHSHSLELYGRCARCAG